MKRITAFIAVFLSICFTAAGIDHHQIFFDDGLTTLLLWKRDYSQSEPSEFGPPKKIGLEISILDNYNKPNRHHLRTIRLKKAKKRK